MTRYALLCTYPSGVQRIVTTELAFDAESVVTDEYLECIRLTNQNCHYEIVELNIRHMENAHE